MVSKGCGRPARFVTRSTNSDGIESLCTGYSPFIATTELPSLHPLEPHAFPVGLPGRDVTAREAGLALRHLLLWTAQCLPPRRALRRARQRGIDDRLDLVEGEHEFGKLLLLQIVTQRVIIVHGQTRWMFKRI